MLPSLLLAAALAPAAPVPPGSAGVPTGPPPAPMYLKADATGQVVIIGTVSQVVTINRSVVVNENGKQVVKQEPMQITQHMSTRTALADLNGKFATVGGATLTGAEAANRVCDGAVLFVSADGKPVEKAWLRGLSEDTIVVTTEALKNLKLNHGTANQAATPAPRVVMLAAGDDGKVRVDVNPNAAAADPFANRAALNNGLVNGIPAAATTTPKPLDDVKFDAYDLTGKIVPRAEALKRLKNGGLALIAGDHRLPDAAYLKAFGTADLLVLASTELVLPTTPNGFSKAAVNVMPAPVPVQIARPIAVKAAVKVEVVKP